MMIAQNMRPLRDAEYRNPWGACVHTTGSGITDNAVYETLPLVSTRVKPKRRKRVVPLRPIDVAIDWYRKSQNGANKYLWGGPTYVVDHDGTIWRLAPEEVLTNHCGGPNRDRYRDMSWLDKASRAMVARWNAQWGPRYDDPYDLFPSRTPNKDYVGVEMIPCGDGFGDPMRDGLRFTKHQHDSLIDLLRDIGMRRQWPPGWWRGSRLVGHEDVDPIERDDEGGGWDPGWLRAKPYFDFDYVRRRVG